MSEGPSSSRECNHCNQRVAVVTLGNLVICSQCTNVIVRTAPQPLSQDLTMEDFTVDLEWGGEIFRTTEDNNIEFNDAAYVALVQNLRERDNGVTRGATKSAIDALKTFVVDCSSSSTEVCAVCKDAMVIGELLKKLPCEHCYHENCILPWLWIRNTCPLCRFQL